MNAAELAARRALRDEGIQPTPAATALARPGARNVPRTSALPAPRQ